jgi:hypothetical protein
MSFGAVAAIGGALIGADAAGDAADSQANSAAAATAAQRDMFNKQVELQAPFRQVGLEANNRLAYLLGIGAPPSVLGSEEIYDKMYADANEAYKKNYGVDIKDHQGNTGVDTWVANIRKAANDKFLAQGGSNTVDPAYGSLLKKFGMSDFEADPGYQFRMDEGMKGVERSAASRGGLFSGAAGKQLQRFGQGLASQEYGNAYNRYNADQTNQYNRIAGVVNTGQGATNQVSNAAANFGDQAASNLIGAGNAQAAGGIAQANAITGGINDAFNYYNQSNALNKALQKPQMDWYS